LKKEHEDLKRTSLAATNKANDEKDEVVDVMNTKIEHQDHGFGRPAS